MLPHTALHLLPGLFDRKGDAESQGEARTTDVFWPKDASCHGVWHNPCQVHAAVRTAVQFHLHHVFKYCGSQVCLLHKATRPGNVREGLPETDM